MAFSAVTFVCFYFGKAAKESSIPRENISMGKDCLRHAFQGAGRALFPGPGVKKTAILHQQIAIKTKTLQGLPQLFQKERLQTSCGNTSLKKFAYAVAAVVSPTSKNRFPLFLGLFLITALPRIRLGRPRRRPSLPPPSQLRDFQTTWGQRGVHIMTPENVLRRKHRARPRELSERKSDTYQASAATLLSRVPARMGQEGPGKDGRETG